MIFVSCLFIAFLFCQVYVVAMIKDGSALNSKDTFSQNLNQIDDSNSEDFGKFEFQTESLLSLVQPELLSLSQYWLAALRDHALLSLPPGIMNFLHYFIT